MLAGQSAHCLEVLIVGQAEAAEKLSEFFAGLGYAQLPEPNDQLIASGGRDYEGGARGGFQNPGEELAEVRELLVGEGEDR